MRIHYFVPTFYPEETGFAIAFKNLCLSIIDIPEIEKIIVYSPIKPEKTELHEKIEVRLVEKHIFASKFINLFGEKLGLMVINIFLSAWFKKLDFKNTDLIFVESIFLSYLSLFLARKVGKEKVITRVHGCLPEIAVWTKDKKRNVLVNYLMQTDKIAVTTYHYIEYLIENFNFRQDNSKRFYIIPNTVKFKENSKSFLKTEKLSILQLGRMDDNGYFQKGFQDVLQGLHYLETIMSDKDLKDIKYTSIGNGKNYLEFSKKLDQLEKIESASYETLSNIEVQEQIASADVILLPSRYEGMSMFATEALAKGKVFIYTSNGGLRDMIIDNFNGFSVRTFDYIQIAEAIKTLFYNRSKIDEFGKNSINLFEKEFSYEVVKNKFSVIIKDFLTEKTIK
jgi:glycosyltransferase involved in cell wall biosynthesis